MSKKVKTGGTVQVQKKPLKTRIWNNRGYYLMFLPVLVFLIITQYWPMLGIRYAFTTYTPAMAARGISPEFVGFKHFIKLFSEPAFWTSFVNTLELSILKLIITTAASVVVSILLNEMGNLFAKKVLQTVIYLPHFMSWVVTASIFTLFLSPSVNGMVNGLLKEFGIIKDSIYFLGDTKWWRPMYYIINIWKETGK